MTSNKHAYIVIRIKQIAFLFPLLSLFNSVFGVNLDSLKTQLQFLEKDELVDAYLVVGEQTFYLTGNTDSLIHYSTKALNTAKTNNYIPGIINSLTYMGIGYTMKGDKITSNICWNQALKIATAIKDYASIADLESKIGYNYHNVSNFKQALVHYFRAAETMEDLQNYAGLTVTYNNIAGIFETQNQYEECLFYLRKSLAIVDKLKDPYDRIIVYSQVTIEMAEIGKTDPMYLDSALVYAMKGLPIAIEFKYPQKIGTFYLQLSMIYSLKRYKEKANEYFIKAKEYRGYLSQHFQLLYYLRATEHYIDGQNFPVALSFIDSTYQSLTTDPNDFFGVEISKHSYELNKKMGNYKNALFAHEKLRTYEANIFNREQSNQLNKLQQKFNKAQNEKTIAQLNQEKQLLNKNKQIDQLKINILGIGAVLLLAIILLVVFIYRQSRIKQKKDTLEAELRLNRSRMNPHFFFNALTSIQSLSLKEHKSKEVSFYISKFSKIMRASLESTYTELSTIENELEFLKQYLDIQKFYSDNKFNYTFEISDHLESSEYYIPPMLLQPFVENSIEHGFKHIVEGGIINIQIEQLSNNIKITITDNGSGFKEGEKHKSYPSRATQIIKDRIFLLNKKYKSNASYIIKNLNGTNGMQVIIHLPLITEK